LAIVAGIDEAGFGPLLGPLVVTGVAFRVPDSQTHRCLWDTLSETCTRPPDRDSRRLAVADSKQLFRGRASNSAVWKVTVPLSSEDLTAMSLFQEQRCAYYRSDIRVTRSFRREWCSTFRTSWKTQAA